MKIKTLGLVLSLVTGIFLIQTIHAESLIQIQSNHQSVTFDIQNMTCPMCKFTIKKALQGVVGVQKVIVDYDKKIAVITFDPQKTNTEALIKATTNAGYPATVRQTK